MTLIYEWNHCTMSLEHFITQYNFQTLWNELLKEEYKFWKDITLDDLIVETSDVFEETLWEQKWDIKFKNTDDNPFDYNILLDGLRNQKKKAGRTK